MTTTFIPDPVHNAAQPVAIAGEEYRIRELPWLVLRDHLGAIARIASQFEGPVRTLADLDTGKILAEFSDVLVAIIAASCNRQTREIENLPTSVLLDLLGHVLTAHERALTSFFRLRDRWQGITGENKKEPSEMPSSKRASSPISSPPDSPSMKSEG